jgi:hypothetical protein
MGLWATPWTVAFCIGETILSTEATEMTPIPPPGSEVYHAPSCPSLRSVSLEVSQPEMK